MEQWEVGVLSLALLLGDLLLLLLDRRLLNLFVLWAGIYLQSMLFLCDE